MRCSGPLHSGLAPAVSRPLIANVRRQHFMTRSAAIVASFLALSITEVCAQSDIITYRDGRFTAILAFTDKADEFVAQWYKPAQPGYRPQLQATRKVSLHKL